MDAKDDAVNHISVLGVSGETEFNITIIKDGKCTVILCLALLTSQHEVRLDLRVPLTIFSGQVS